MPHSGGTSPEASRDSKHRWSQAVRLLIGPDLAIAIKPAKDRGTERQRNRKTEGQARMAGTDSARPTAIKPLPKTILARRTGKLRSEPMNFPPKFPHPPDRGLPPGILPFSVSVFSNSAFPEAPFSPPSLFQEPPAKSKFLATQSKTILKLNLRTLFYLSLLLSADQAFGDDNVVTVKTFDGWSAWSATTGKKLFSGKSEVGFNGNVVAAKDLLGYTAFSAVTGKILFTGAHEIRLASNIAAAKNALGWSAWSATTGKLLFSMKSEIEIVGSIAAAKDLGGWTTWSALTGEQLFSMQSEIAIAGNFAASKSLLGWSVWSAATGKKLFSGQSEIELADTVIQRK